MAGSRRRRALARRCADGRWRRFGVLRQGKGEEARGIECGRSPDGDALKRR